MPVPPMSMARVRGPVGDDRLVGMIGGTILDPRRDLVTSKPELSQKGIPVFVNLRLSRPRNPEKLLLWLQHCSISY